MAEITTQQIAFVNEYLKDMVAMRAAIRAGYSEHTASVQAYDLLSRPHIQEYLAHEFHKRNMRTLMEADKMLKELAIITSSDVTDYFNSTGGMLTFKEFKSLPKEMTRAIESVQEKVSPAGGVTIRIKLHNKIKGLEMALKHLGLLVDRFAGKVGFGQDPDAGPIRTEFILPGYPKDNYTLEEWEEACLKLEQKKEEVKLLEEIIGEKGET